MKRSKPVAPWPQDTDSFARLCLGCRGNRHKECARHDFDHFEPEATYLISQCDCACEGEVPPDGTLIGLVAQLRQEAATAAQAIEELGSALEWRGRVCDELRAAISSFLDDAYDDEGDFRPSDRAMAELATVAAAANRPMPQPDKELEPPF